MHYLDEYRIAHLRSGRRSLRTVDREVSREWSPSPDSALASLSAAHPHCRCLPPLRVAGPADLDDCHYRVFLGSPYMVGCRRPVWGVLLPDGIIAAQVSLVEGLRTTFEPT